MFTGIGNNPITEDLAYYNQLTKTGEAHKANMPVQPYHPKPKDPKDHA
jgi:hypothetical protein